MGVIRSYRWQWTACLVVVVGVLITDIAVAATRHSKQTQQAKQQRVDTSYVERVAALSERLYVAVQPVQDGLRTAASAKVAQLFAIEDALANTKTATLVGRIQRDLGKLDAPAELSDQAGALSKSLRMMRQSLTRLEGISDDKASKPVTAPPYARAGTRLVVAERDWSNAVEALTTQADIAMPRAPRYNSDSRSPAPSKFSWIFRASSVCARANMALYKLDDVPVNSVSALVSYHKRFATIARGLDRDLRAVPRPSRDKARLAQTVIRPMAAHRTFLKALGAQVDAARAGKLASLQTATARARAAGEAMERVGRGMRSYGSNICAVYFGAGPDKNGKRGSQTLSA